MIQGACTFNDNLINNRINNINEMKKYKFKINELVCKHMSEKYGEKAWMFLDPRLLEVLHVIRYDILGTEMVINNYGAGGNFTQRGMRCNCCNIVKEKKAPYLSAHVTGCGVDFDAKGYTAEQARQKIIANKDLLPYPIRLESGVNWVHLDVYHPVGSNEKVVLFNP